MTPLLLGFATELSKLADDGAVAQSLAVKYLQNREAEQVPGGQAEDLGRLYLERKRAQALSRMQLSNKLLVGGLAAGVPTVAAMRRSLSAARGSIPGKAVGLSRKGKALYLAGLGSMGLAALGLGGVPLFGIQAARRRADLEGYETFKEQREEKQHELARRMNMEESERQALEKQEARARLRRKAMLAGGALAAAGLGALALREPVSKPAPSPVPPERGLGTGE